MSEQMTPRRSSTACPCLQTALLLLLLLGKTAALSAPLSALERKDHARRVRQSRRRLPSSSVEKCHESPNPCTRTASCPSIRAASEVASHFQLDLSFYAKFVESAGGIPIVSSNLCPDEALLQAAMILNRICRHRTEVCRYIADLGIQIAVMADNHIEQTTGPRARHVIQRQRRQPGCLPS